MDGDFVGTADGAFKMLYARDGMADGGYFSAGGSLEMMDDWLGMHDDGNKMSYRTDFKPMISMKWPMKFMKYAMISMK